MNLVIDASVTLSWSFEDEGGDYGVAVLEAQETSEAVPASLWPLEVTNGLLTSYGAAYLELAARLGVPLATLDGPLRTAAVAECVRLY